MTVRIERRDCIEVMARLTAEGVKVDAVVTDPPYHLTSIVKRFGAENAAPAKVGKTGAYKRHSTGFMGKKWDGGDIAFRPETWRLCFDLMKPGAHLVAFGGTRTHHRIWCAIEDAGFDIRDTLAWLYASGFPKSHNLHGDWEGWGTALKPAFEPIILARKPLEGTVAGNVFAHGTGALNIDGCRIEGMKPQVTRGPSTFQKYHDGRLSGAPNVGRWPANVVHDGSEEVLAGFPESKGAQGVVCGTEPSETGQSGIYGRYRRAASSAVRGDSGSAARFFYTAKADKGDRLGSRHPTVKPVDLMRWLVRLVTPPKGLVLDPFAGTGTTGMACMAEGFGCILIEREAEYVADIHRRLAHVRGADAPLFAEEGE